MLNPVSILYKSIADRYRPVSYPDGPITARYRFIKNAGWEHYENMRIKIYRKFHLQTLKNFWLKNSDIFILLLKTYIVGTR